MIGYFKQRNSFQLPAVLVLAILLKISFVSAKPEKAGYFDGGGLLTSYLNDQVVVAVKPGLLAAIGLLLLVGSALYANYVISNRRMFSQRHSLVAVCIILFTSLYPASNLYLPTLIVLPIFIGFFAQITALYHTTHAKSSLVNAGILAGLGYLLYHPFIFLLPACFIGLAYMRPFRLSEWILLLLGMATPLYFLLATEYLTNHWNPLRHLPNFAINSINWQNNAAWWTALVAVVCWVVMAMMGWQRQSMRMVIQGRKNWYALLMMGLFALPGLVWPSGNQTGMLVLLAFPLGSLLANSFSSESKSRGQTMLFWGILVLIAIVSWSWR